MVLDVRKRLHRMRCRFQHISANSLITVVRGERASRSIVNRTTALWSIWVVASLIPAGSGLWIILVKMRGREVDESRGAFGARNIDRQLY